MVRMGKAHTLKSGLQWVRRGNFVHIFGTEEEGSPILCEIPVLEITAIKAGLDNGF
jgi:hypothetical protein